MKTILLLAIIVSTTALELPSNFKTCKRSDPKLSECVANASKNVTLMLAKGLKSFKILPLEPLAVDSIKIGESEDSVSLKQEYWNIKVHGLTKDGDKLRVFNYKIDWDKLIFSWETFNSQVDFVADYKLSGRILILSLQGEGKCNISMHDLRTTHVAYFEKFERDGEIYMRTKKYIVKFFPKHVDLQFNNLFSGDQILGDQIQKFLRDNSEIIFKELQGPFEEAFGFVFAKITNDIFTRVPLNKLFK
ncbi:protein takeout [Monomorium pharaonis]|uniref:protein takeout n=1 Tax=Monomorium pharaonis TaxID=307658 RepID=UPI00063FC1C9|nr:protein takeout [Monomorium pharaonis]